MEYGAVVVWWLALVALGIAGLPIASTVLSRLPDRGAGLALPVALVVFVIPIYWIGHVTFGPVAIAVGLLVLVAASLGLAWYGPEPRVDRFAEGIAVFTAAFLLLVAVRAVDPSIHPAGGEKFLDYGLLNTLLRAARLPPEDMWFAGTSVNYYYGGHLIAAILTRVTGLPARLTYNLALAGFYGLYVAAAYGVAGAAAASRGWSYRKAGAAGAFFVGFASNLVPALQAVLWVLPDGIAVPLARAVASVTALDASRIVSPDAFFYWTAHLVIRGTNNEFPLFAFVNGDLHAHMMSPPFLLLAVGLALAYYRTPADAVRRRRALVFGGVPPIAGLIAVINTWSFPTPVGVIWLAMLFGPSPSRLLPAGLADRLPDGSPVRREAGRIAAATVAALGVAGLGVLWGLPFFLGPATGGSPRWIAPFPDRSGLVEFVLVHGWILAVFGLYLGSRALPTIDPDRRARVAGLILAVALAGLLAGAAAVALVLPLLVIAWVLLRRREVGFETVLFVAGAGLVLLVEFVYLKEQAGPGRYNTVFKTYTQVWALWATGAGAALVGLLATVRDRWPSDARQVRAARVFAILLVVSLSFYGVVALGGHFEGADEPTLDATTWARHSHPKAWDAIRWLDARRGQPTIVTAPGCWCNPRGSGARPYRWVNAPSAFTGLPTVAGWSHEAGYHGRAAYRERVADVRTIYTGPWKARAALLKRYDVEFIYVGPNERQLYGANVSAFADHAGEGEPLAVAYENRRVTIYAVDRAAL